MKTERKLKNGNIRHYCPICGAAIFDEVKIGMEPFTICGLPVTKVNFENIKPNEYDILACLTKYYPETFEDFCSEFGYDEDSRSAEQIYLACVKEYKQLTRIFTDEQMEELREIN